MTCTRSPPVIWCGLFRQGPLPRRQPLKSARQPRPNVLPNREDWEILLGVATAGSIAAVSSPGSVSRTDGPAACDCSCRPQPRKAVQDLTPDTPELWARPKRSERRCWTRSKGQRHGRPAKHQHHPASRSQWSNRRCTLGARWKVHTEHCPGSFCLHYPQSIRQPIMAES